MRCMGHNIKRIGIIHSSTDTVAEMHEPCHTGLWCNGASRFTSPVVSKDGM